MRRIEYSDEANIDIQYIWASVAQFNVAAAESLRDAIVLKVGLLARSPGVGHAHDDSPDPNYRFAVVDRKYWIVFAFDDEMIRVVRVIHGSRDLRRLL